MRKAVLILLIIHSFGVVLKAQEDVGLFDFWKYYSEADNALYKDFCNTSFLFLEDRKAKIASLNTKDDWIERQAEVKEKLTRLTGVFPEKTPLNARITGVIKRDTYSVEKLVYESMPGYYVTAGLFIPKKIKGKAPAIIYVSGHTSEGFRSKTYQHVIINLVKKGFVVLAIDPMGQGERKQYIGISKGKSKFGPTSEHSYVGAQCYISGYSPTKYFVWDGIRAVDYLLTRKEVDPKRIGLTGRSGGGTQTAYLAALDDRIEASAPECFITSMEYLLKSKGPQDAEQNLYRMIYEGLDHADLIEVRAPKPTLMITTTRDMFSIQGARDTYNESKRAYQLLGDEGALKMVEDDYGHASTKKNREAMYAFFQNTLNNPGSSDDLEVEIFEENELWVTETGQVVTSLGGESLFNLNKKIVEKQVEALENKRKNKKIALTSEVKKVTGFTAPTDFGAPIFSGRYVKEDYTLEKYLVKGSGDYMLPIALIKPNMAANKNVVMLLADKGMDYAVNEDEMVLDMVKKGQAVLLFDVAGIGSLGSGYLIGDSNFSKTSYSLWFGGIMAGKSIVGKRMEDILRIIQFIKTGIKSYGSIIAMAKGSVSSEMLHASVFSDDIDQLCLISPFLSFADIALTKSYESSFIPSTVAGAINSYDLVDLIAAYAPNKLMLIDPVLSNGNKARMEVANVKLTYVKEKYETSGFKENLKVVVDDNKSHDDLIGRWIEKG